eukprot:g15520.t1
MGMALESEQEARAEIERELELEKKERHITEDELAGHKKQVHRIQSKNESALQAQVEQLRNDISKEVKRRQRAETELYRSAVAITDHTKMVQKLSDSQKLNDDLKRQLRVKEDKVKDLEKTIYRSSQIMFEQIEKKVEVERRARLQAETDLDNERKTRKKLEDDRLKLVRNLETRRQQEEQSSKDTRQHLEKVVYKSSVSIYKQLEERMKEEQRLRAELQNSTENLLKAQRELTAERLARKNLEALATRSTIALSKGKEQLAETEQKAVEKMMSRNEIMARREDDFHKRERMLRKDLDNERKARHEAEDSYSRVRQELELTRKRLRANVEAVKEARQTGRVDTVQQLQNERQLHAVENEARAAAEENIQLRKRIEQLKDNISKLKETLQYATNLVEEKAKEIAQLKSQNMVGASDKRHINSSFAEDAYTIKEGMKRAKIESNEKLLKPQTFQRISMDHNKSIFQAYPP